ncbi:uncharacterized protein LOC141663705 [Apium graveolens]|uniref:uncharacterized protein LOC141663705 n=1 Tax=Apium graveolens TaxID=4045 RepID=UPI003D795CB2
MGERKVLSKYYSPDFIKVHANNNQIKVRMMLSLNIRCNLCGNYIGKGTKFNSRKEEVIGQRYVDTIKIFRFYIKCSACCSEITVITDPQNSDYIVESGASRIFEPWREEQETREVGDALENRARGLKREMGDVVALEELRFIKSRHNADVSVDALINHLVPEKKKDELCQEDDEALIKSEFGGLEDEEEDILDSNNNNNIGFKKTRVSGDFSYICGKGSCATSGGKLILSHICAMKKNPEQKALERTGNKDKTKDDQAKKTLQSLFKDYESDEEDS